MSLKSSSTFFFHLLIPCIILSTLLIFLVPMISVNTFIPPPSTINIKMWISLSHVRRPAMKLIQRNDDFIPFDKDQLTVRSDYAYLWIEILNESRSQNNIVVSNTNFNHYTELLKPAPLGALTISTGGDTVPVYRSPIRFCGTAFPVSIAGKSIQTFVIEYQDSQVIRISPQFSQLIPFFSRIKAWQIRLSYVLGIESALILLYMILTIIYRKKIFFMTGILFTTALFSSLIQSRFLKYMIKSLPLSDWIFPLSWALVLMAVIVFIKLFLGDSLYLREKRALYTVLIATAILGFFSFFLAPFTILAILKLLSFPVGCGIAVLILLKMRRGNWEALWILLTVIPWLASCVPMPSGVYREERSLWGGAVSMVFITVVLLLREMNSRIRDHSALITKRNLNILSSLQSSIVRQIGHRMQFPLDTILATANLVEHEYTDPAVVTAGRMISKETTVLKELINNEIGTHNSGSPLLDMEIEWDQLSPEDGKHFGQVWIFHSDREQASRVAMILRSGHYHVTLTSDIDAVIHADQQGKVDVLIVIPVAVGGMAFKLCRLIRAEKNMMKFPIMLLSFQYAESLIKAGYAAGINEFAMAPFDGPELIARTASLVRLKEITEHNIELAQSEREKNIFLYFLTHNINTPLTLLINRIRELEDLNSPAEMNEIVEDLQESSRQISDIVRNILISFQLADGRHTLFIEETDIAQILHFIERDIRKKVVSKSQNFSMKIPQDLAPVQIDSSSIKGALYNLVDNAVKYSPVGGTIEVIVQKSHTLQITVQDSGPGIPEEEQHLLFHRFESLSTRPSGGEPSTGLGLFVAYELIRMNGGSLDYVPDSSGSRFVVTIPYNPPNGRDQ